MRRRDGNRERKTADNLPKVVQKYRDRKRDRGRAQRQRYDTKRNKDEAL